MSRLNSLEYETPKAALPSPPPPRSVTILSVSVNHPALSALLSTPIDYAGLFPPAALPLPRAVKAYREIMESDLADLCDKFICPADQLAALASCIQAENMEEVPIAVVGAPLKPGPDMAAQLRAELTAMTAHPVLMVEGYEVKVPVGDSLTGALRALKGAGLNDADLDVFLEFPWSPESEDAMAEAISQMENIGFKARCGGMPDPHPVPSPAELAAFIHTCVSLEAPLKFTAGLHQAIGHTENGVFHHGFVNVLAAAALALTQDLNRAELEEILTLPAGRMAPEGDDLVLGSWRLTPDEADELWTYCGGFGSCSVHEPKDSLRALGW